MIGHLGEIIIYVEEMSRQLRFYCDVLGFRVIEPIEEAALDEAYWILLNTGTCKLALHGGGKRRFGEDAPKFVFFVDDIDAARARLQSAGCQVGDVRSPIDGVFVVDAFDPEGNVFSLEHRESSRVKP
jgi:predicted enzyme related to lactoylglutathione lyase